MNAIKTEIDIALHLSEKLPRVSFIEGPPRAYVTRVDAHGISREMKYITHSFMFPKEEGAPGAVVFYIDYEQACRAFEAYLYSVIRDFTEHVREALVVWRMKPSVQTDSDFRIQYRDWANASLSKPSGEEVWKTMTVPAYSAACRMIICDRSVWGSAAPDRSDVVDTVTRFGSLPG